MYVMEVLNSQTIEDNSTAYCNLNGRDDSNNIVTVPEDTNENGQLDENDDEGYTGSAFC